MATNEEDLRLRLFNSLLLTPHRNLPSIYPVHNDILTTDPRFYVQLAAWYAIHGEVRDHKEMFIVSLVLSDFPGHRDVGLALLRELPPYQVGRVHDFIKGRVHLKVKKVKAGGGEGEGTPRMRRPRGAVASPAPAVEGQPATEKWGLFRNVPRSVKTEISRYLREREANPERFDGAVLQARRALKRLYASLHIKPSPRAQAILFEENPPPDSRLFALKQIARATTPAEQARAIVEHRIPYRVAASVIKQMTPTILVALVNSMSPQELINNIGSLKKHGAFDNDDLRALIEQKLEAAQTDKRVSGYKAKVAVEAAGATGELAAKLEKVTEVQVRAKGTIKRPTALLLDKSGSMDVALEVGRQLGAMISSICQADLYAYAFDTVAYPIEPQGSTLADWEKAMMGIHAMGGTACGVALEWMRHKGQRVEQIVMVTDEEENQAPRFRDAYHKYAEAMAVRPSVIFVKIGQASNQLEKDCTELGIPPQAFEFKGDYYSLPNLIPMLTYPSMSEMVMEIMLHPLPERRKE